MSTATYPDNETTIGQLVAERPDWSHVFERLGIDYCCGGGKTLGEACGEKGLDPERVRAELASIEESPVSAGPKPAEMGLVELCDYIEQAHHLTSERRFPGWVRWCARSQPCMATAIRGCWRSMGSLRLSQARCTRT